MFRISVNITISYKHVDNCGHSSVDLKPYNHVDVLLLLLASSLGFFFQQYLVPSFFNTFVSIAVFPQIFAVFLKYSHGLTLHMPVKEVPPRVDGSTLPRLVRLPIPKLDRLALPWLVSEAVPRLIRLPVQKLCRPSTILASK